jgi:hypothetical protein
MINIQDLNIRKAGSEAGKRIELEYFESSIIDAG